MDPNGKKQLELKTPRLLLRAARESDIPAFFDIFADEDVMRSTPPHSDIAQTQKYMDTMIASPTNGVLDFVLVLSSPQPSEGIIIGKAGIFTSPPDQPEIGFLLHRSHWRQGLTLEALEVLIPHFWTQGVDRVIADVDPRNEASQAILRRVGFEEYARREKTIETHLGWCDSVYLALSNT